MTLVILTVSAATTVKAQGKWEEVGVITQLDGRVLKDPTGITFDGTYIWATEQHATGISGIPLYKIDPETMELVEEIDVPVENCCVQGLAWDGTYIWISGNGYTIYRFEPTTKELVHTCTRPSNPQAIGLTCIGSSLYATGWYGGEDTENIMILEPYSCDYTKLNDVKAGTSGNYGLAWDGQNLIVAGRYDDSSRYKKIYKYSISGKYISDFEYLWVCEYGSQFIEDGKIHKIRLLEPQFISLKVYEKTGAMRAYTFDSMDGRLYKKIDNPGPVGLGYGGYDFATGGCEYYDVYFSDADGNCLNLNPGDPLLEPVYLTLQCMDLNCNNMQPDPAPSWNGAGNNIDAIIMECFDGQLWAVELTDLHYGLCDLPWEENTTQTAENALGTARRRNNGYGRRPYLVHSQTRQARVGRMRGHQPRQNIVPKCQKVERLPENMECPDQIT